MKITDYQAQAENTKSIEFNAPEHWLYKIKDKNYYTAAQMSRDIAHALIGISTEGGELLDVVKKAMFYGKAVDLVNVDEEVGDIMWYIAIYCNAREISIEQICETNNAKLKARYPDKFTTFHAKVRDLDTERKILEEGTEKSIRTESVNPESIQKTKTSKEDKDFGKSAYELFCSSVAEVHPTQKLFTWDILSSDQKAVWGVFKTKLGL